jgi:ADP-heptose:LPS heptosyltransferase
MGLLNNIKDRFKNAEFNVAPNKKLKTLSKEFKDSFGVDLVFYKGNKIAESTLTLKQLNDKTSIDVKKNSNAELKVKASQKVDEVENAFLSSYGVKVQVKREGKLVPNEITLGQAARGEY